jgi:transposase
MDAAGLLQAWQLDVGQVRQRMYEAPRPRERERWHAGWLVAQGWTQEHIAQALDRDAHTVGTWLEAFRQRGPAGLQAEHHGGAPPP